MVEQVSTIYKLIVFILNYFIVLFCLVALGHPLGASGTKLMTTLVYALINRKKRWGLQSMCEGGGMANMTIIENLML